MIVKIEFTESMKYEKFKVTKRGDGRYVCRIPISYETSEDGKKTYQYKSVYGVDEMDAKIKRAEFIDRQIQTATQEQHISEMLITKMEEWLYVHKYQKVKSNSFDRLENTLEYQIIPALETLKIKDIRIADVTTLHIEQIMKYNLNKGYSYSTLLKIKRFLVSFFSCYEDQITKNPMRQYQFYKKENVISTQANLRVQKAAALEKIAKRNAELAADGVSKIHITEEETHLAQMKLESQVDESDIHYFNTEEIEKMKDAIYNGYTVQFTSRSGNIVESARYYPKQGKFFLFMLSTGIRCGEATALRYSDMSFDDLTVNIYQNAVNVKSRDADGRATGKRNRNIGSVKTATSKQVLDISPYALEILSELKAEEPEGYDGYIVHNDKYQAISSKTLWQRFNKLLKGAGIECCGLHSLRHTFATILYEMTDGDIKLVSTQLRHNDTGFTAKTYVHQSKSKTQEVLNNFRV